MTGGPSERGPSRGEVVLVGALIAMVVVPVLGAGIRLAAEGWFPTFDDAVIANRSYDVLTRHTPLVGQFSLAGSRGPSTHSPGPMLFWYSALSARGPVWAIPVWTSVVNAACFAGSILLARRRGGTGLAAVVALGCLALVRSLGPVTMAEVWNPWIGLVPLVLLVFLTWSVLDGDRRLLPVAVLVGSFTLQGHLSLMFPSMALLVVAVVGGWLVPLARRRSVPGGWAPVLWSVPVGLACWVLPVYQELTTDPGNLTLLARSGGEPGGRGGVLAVKATLWRSLGVPPTWAQGEPDPLHFATLSFSPVGWPQLVQTAAVLGLLAGVGVLAVRARDRLVASAVAVAAALVAGMVATALTIPLDRGLVAGYTFRWFTIASFVVWLAIGLGLWRLVLEPAWRTRPGAGTEATRWPVASPAVLAVGAVLLGVVALALPWRDQFAFSYDPGRALGRVVVDATEPGGTYLVGRSGRWDLGFTPVVGHELRKAGRHPVMMRTRIEAFGEHHAPTGVRCDGVIVLQEPGDVPEPGARRLAEIDVPDSGYLGDRIIVSMAADDSADGQC
ncbi:MAG: hypothetical protein KF703_18655 [Actinobacteria bacterium]|nr:hypothetical protein [Actinomycetota bacterium]